MKLKKFLVWVFIVSFSFLGTSQYQEGKYWIFFKDKGLSKSQLENQLSNLKQKLPDRVLKRRAKVRQSHEIVDMSDLPIYQPYLEKLDELKITPIVRSKWLNAISAKLTSEQIEIIKNLPFVKKVQPVARYKRRKIKEQEVEDLLKLTAPQQDSPLDYGNSHTQNQLMRVPEVHQMGVNGAGVLIGMLDTGFFYQEHEAFVKLEVVAEYDFINQDNVTRNESDDNDRYDQHNHGTSTLSVIGGFKEGQLIGPAYGAKFLLAKTEYVPTETQIEEDYWAAGIEWLEENGADVVNSSLGYTDWYNYADFDGNTAITTIAADLAVKKGVVVVNSMGNEGNFPGSIIAPADGDSVISAGAVNSSGQLTSFSSIGPTWDQRIKPDVVAMGSGVYTASASFTKGSGYSYCNGTSFSSPLTASVAALVLSAHPYLTPIQVREALRQTADNADNPNNEYGWGLVNAYEAVFYHGLFFSNLPEVSTDNLGHKVTVKIFSKNPVVPDSVFLYYSVNENPFIKIKLDLSSIENEYQAWIPFQTITDEIKIYFYAVDESGDAKLHPHFAPDEYFVFYAYDTTVNPGKKPELPSTFVLYQNYPNPFNTTTKIKYDILTPGQVNLSIYNINGQLVRTLIDCFHPVGINEKVWDGKADDGTSVASGVYFYKLKAGDFLDIKKMLFLR